MRSYVILILVVCSIALNSAIAEAQPAGKGTTIKGKLLNKGNPRKPLDQLVEAFRKEGFYSPEPPNVVADTFTLVVYVERRGPTEYTSKLEEEKPKAAKTDAKTKSKTKRPDGNE